jgi:hypothetical protein
MARAVIQLPPQLPQLLAIQAPWAKLLETGALFFSSTKKWLSAVSSKGLAVFVAIWWPVLWSYYEQAGNDKFNS